MNENYDDGQLSFLSYWDKHKACLANQRNWSCEGNCPDHPECLRHCLYPDKRIADGGTLHNYDRHMNLVGFHLGTKPISDLTFADICRAISAVRTKKNYSSSTAGGIASTIRVIFDFAAARGDAYNITKFSRAGKESSDLMVILGSDHPPSYIRNELRKERERLADTVKSLTAWQLKKLTSLLWDCVEEDGRYALIYLMLYAGLRPAEGRALCWKDVTPFVDHCDRELINIYKIRDGRGVIKHTAKTENGFRRIPVHIELQAFLDRRRAFVQKHYPGPIDDLPICCYRNDFARPCRDYEVAQLAQELFSEKLSMDASCMYSYWVLKLSEEYDGDHEEDAVQHLTLYVLRRNFWTWLQSSTLLSDTQKRLIMGHELPPGLKRKDFNNENMLWEICCKLDLCVISAELHREHLYLALSPDREVSFNDQGLCRIHLTPEALAKGLSLQMFLTAEEPGEAISVTALSPVRSIGGIRPEATVMGVPANTHKQGINCAYENWLAHLHPVKPKPKESKSERISSDEE